RYVHLADAETNEQHEHRERETRHQWYKNEQDIRRQVRDHHGPDQADACGESRSEERRNSRQNICPEKNHTKFCWLDSKPQVEPIGRETLNDKAAAERVQGE